MKTVVVLCAMLCLPVMAAGFEAELGQTGKSTAQVAVEGSFDLDASADRAFWFFTPQGERKWVTGWNPEPVYPPRIDVAFRTNAVFRVNDESEQSLWTIVEANLQGHVAEYVYVVEGQRLSRVRVEVRPRGATRSRVSVHYIHTAISEKGVQFVATVTKESFAQKMLNWQRLLSAALCGTSIMVPLGLPLVPCSARA